MKTYRVSFYYEENNTTTVEANSPEEARAKLMARLENDGLDGLVYAENDRNYGVTDEEEL